MKKKISLIFGLFILMTVFFSGCGQSEEIKYYKYVIFTDNYGTEYVLSYNGKNVYSVDFDIDKAYTFTYQGYFEDSDTIKHRL